jgi:hypothetical protein
MISGYWLFWLNPLKSKFSHSMDILCRQQIIFLIRYSIDDSEKMPIITIQ